MKKDNTPEQLTDDELDGAEGGAASKSPFVKDDASFASKADYDIASKTGNGFASKADYDIVKQSS